MTVNVTAVNDAPVSTVWARDTNEDSAIAFSGTNKLQVSNVDADSAPITTTLSVSHGTLAVTSVGSGATIQDSGTGMVTLTGSVSQIDAIFNASNLIFTPAANWCGATR